MALIKADPNDMFGTTPNGGRDAAILGTWLEASTITGTVDTATPSMPRLQSSIVRTGGLAWQFPFVPAGVVAANWLPRLRIGFGAARAAVGASFALNFEAMPQNADHWGFSLRDNGNVPILTFIVETDGSIEVKRGDATGTQIGLTSAQIPVGSWQHIEIYATRSATVGAVEIRFNGNTVLNLTGQNTGAADFSVLHIGSQRGQTNAAQTGVCLDDLIIWDKTGTEFNDFPGPVGVYVLPPNGSTVNADWSVVGAASGHDALAEVPPDFDTSYILSGGPGDISDFDLTNLGPGIGLVRAVLPVSAMRSPEAAEARVDVVSGVSVASGTSRFLPVTYDYFQEPIYLDPATGAPWTRSGVNAARLRFRAL